MAKQTFKPIFVLIINSLLTAAFPVVSGADTDVPAPVSFIENSDSSSAPSDTDSTFNSDGIEPETPGYIKATQILPYLDPRRLNLHSSTALVMDTREGVILFERDIDKQMPIASLTKLMTAMVVLDANLPMEEPIKISRADRDRLRGSRSRLSYGTTLTREDMLYIALAASENRAAHALARTYPGGREAFVDAMNTKAQILNMRDTHFHDPTGLHSKNVSTAKDLVKLVAAASLYPTIKQMTTSGRDHVTDLRSGWNVEFLNTNRLVRRKSWQINLSKTGYIADAGHCLVMDTEIDDRPLIVILLNSWGKYSKFGDSNRIRLWLEKAEQKYLRAISQIANSSQQALIN